MSSLKSPCEGCPTFGKPKARCKLKKQVLRALGVNEDIVSDSEGSAKIAAESHLTQSKTCKTLAQQ